MRVCHAEIKLMLNIMGMGSCCWQLRSATLTAALSVVVSHRTQPREPTLTNAKLVLIKTLKH